MLGLNELNGLQFNIGGNNITIVDVVIGSESIKVVGNNGKSYKIKTLINNGSLILDAGLKDKVIKYSDELEAALSKSKAEAKEALNEKKKAEALADKLLRSGMPIVDVASETRLTVEEVKYIYDSLHIKSKISVTSHVDSVSVKDGLKYDGKPLGSVAKEVYSECVKELGFDKSKTGLFGKQQDLYAKAATKEGYSVWMLRHSNWTDSKSDGWTNNILDDGDKIEETWDNPSMGDFSNDKSRRVVFAYDKKQGSYIFLGIFDVESIDHSRGIKTYNRISTSYNNKIII